VTRAARAMQAAANTHDSRLKLVYIDEKTVHVRGCIPQTCVWLALAELATLAPSTLKTWPASPLTDVCLDERCIALEKGLCCCG
jgi:hypothetical protein